MTFHEVFEDFMQFVQYEYSPHDDTSITTSMRYVAFNPDRTMGSIDFVMSLSLGVTDV